MSATRYELKDADDDSCAEMVQSKWGDWVKIEDYAELEDRIQELEKKIQQAQEALN